MGIISAEEWRLRWIAAFNDTTPDSSVMIALLLEVPLQPEVDGTDKGQLMEVSEIDLTTQLKLHDREYLRLILNRLQYEGLIKILGWSESKVFGEDDRKVMISLTLDTMKTLREAGYME